MIPKHKAPHLNRAQRRHPEKYLAPAKVEGAMPWLLYGLLRKGGYMAGMEVPAAPGFSFPNKPALPAGILAKARRFFNRIIGR